MILVKHSPPVLLFDKEADPRAHQQSPVRQHSQIGNAERVGLRRQLDEGSLAVPQIAQFTAVGSEPKTAGIVGHQPLRSILREKVPRANNLVPIDLKERSRSTPRG